MKIGIVIPTYRRKDGKSPALLRRCVESVTAQTYQNYKLFIIGDHYENDAEILPIIPKNAIYENMPYAKERDIYSGHQLWCSGGGHSYRYALRKLIAAGYDYLISLDHDEWWRPDHLQLLYENMPFAWACTKSTQIGNKFLPNIETDKKVIPFLPKPSGVIHSSVCWNHSLLPLMSRNVFEETGVVVPGDVDLWKRMAVYIKERGLRSIFINELTNFRDSAQYARRKK